MTTKKLDVLVGDVSSLIMLLASLAIISTWVIVSIAKMEMQKLTPEQVALLLGTMGLSAWQRRNGHTK